MTLVGAILKERECRRASCPSRRQPFHVMRASDEMSNYPIPAEPNNGYHGFWGRYKCQHHSCTVHGPRQFQEATTATATTGREKKERLVARGCVVVCFRTPQGRKCDKSPPKAQSTPPFLLSRLLGTCEGLFQHHETSINQSSCHRVPC